MKAARILVGLIIAMSIVFAPARAQAPAQAPPSKSADAQEPTIKVDVDVVNVLVTVKDKKGKLINTLGKDDFEVFEDGQKQPVRYFARETAVPLTIGLLVDTSLSVARVIPEERDAAETFFRRVLATKDEAFVISFDTDVDLLQDYTNNVSLLRRGLERLRVNAPGVNAPIPSAQGPFPGLNQGGTHLYDAVYLAAGEKLATEVGRKAIVLITDGDDQGSKLKIGDAIEAAQKADVIIYGILFVDRSFGWGGGGDSVLKKMSEETGGRMIRVDRSKNLADAFEQISEELRSQYSLGFAPGRPRDGSFRKLQVKVAQNDMRVQARKGYYAIKQ